jgi:hypothetical protein
MSFQKIQINCMAPALTIGHEITSPFNCSAGGSAAVGECKFAIKSNSDMAVLAICENL